MGAGYSESHAFRTADATNSWRVPWFDGKMYESWLIIHNVATVSVNASITGANNLQHGVSVPAESSVTIKFPGYEGPLAIWAQPGAQLLVTVRTIPG